MLSVNGAEVCSPSEMKVSIFDVGDFSHRSAGGGLVADRVAVKRRLHLTWAALTGEQLFALLDAMGDQAFFSAAYPDPATGNQREMACRCEARDMGVLRAADGALLWRDVQMTWTER